MRIGLRNSRLGRRGRRCARARLRSPGAHRLDHCSSAAYERNRKIVELTDIVHVHLLTHTRLATEGTVSACLSQGAQHGIELARRVCPVEPDLDRWATAAQAATITSRARRRGRHKVGITTVPMPSTRAISAACPGPPPPAASSVKRRTSRPRSGGRRCAPRAQ